MPNHILWGINLPFERLSPDKGRLHTCSAPVRRSQLPKNLTARLACVRPPASVHPEPGSNSPLYVCFLKLKLNLKLTLWFSYLVVILFSMIFYSFRFSEISSVSRFRFASAKIKTFSRFTKLFLKFFSVIFITSTPL